ncbi:MAG: GNAT family N-acetyltransferase [Flavobacteriales bacterium]|nr:GNAT family N-acetyltransferase [Flavobacteriales bacterium]
MHHGFRYPNEQGRFLVRPIVPEDRPILDLAFKELSPQSKYMRFFQSASRLSDYQLEYLTHPDGVNHVAWAILDTTFSPHRGVCAMRFIRLKDDPEVAEVAITVIDSYQGQGLSKVAFSVMNLLASELGIKRFRHHVLHQNSVANNSLKKLGILSSHVESGVYIKETHVFASAKEMSDHPQLAGLRKTMMFVQQKLKLD